MSGKAILHGTSFLGNLYEELRYEEKKTIVNEILCLNNNDITVFDIAGKYGAGLALELLGKILHELKVEPGKIRICNKLGWLRTREKSLQSDSEFEPGVWVNVGFEAAQDISYQGMLNCHRQGNHLLGLHSGGTYRAQLVGVHDPDEYINRANCESERIKRVTNVLDSYRALYEMKEGGEVQSIGIGAKDSSIIKMVCSIITVDWAMTACEITPFTFRPSEHDRTKKLLSVVNELNSRGIRIINSAVFNSGFLVGGKFFNYAVACEDSHSEHFIWRAKFVEECGKLGVSPAHVCIQFSFLISGINSIALNAGSLSFVKSNYFMLCTPLPPSVWEHLNSSGLIDTSAITS